MTGRLQGKVAIITGASSGIGRASALAFHKEGASIVCADLNPSPRTSDPASSESNTSTSTHDAITQDGGTAIFCKTDVTSAADMEALLARAVHEFGKVDVLFNNAGILIEGAEKRAMIWQAEEADWDKTNAINAKGVFLGCKYAARQMIAQEPNAYGSRGKIINATSVLGLVGIPTSVCYSASKHAVAGITKTVALDCAPYGVQCNAIAPGFINTPMTASMLTHENLGPRLEEMHPFRGTGVPEDIARVAVFMVSDDNSFMTGAVVPVDGGYTAR